MSKLMAEQVNILNPDKIIAPSINGMDVALEIINYSKRNYPLYAVDVQYRITTPNPTDFNCCSHKYAINIPYSYLNVKDKILIIDDLYVTGDTVDSIIKSMEKAGYNKSNIFTLGLVVDTISAKHNKFPDFYAKSYNISRFTFAWRK